MAEPLACALHTAGRCGAGPGDLVLVLGGGVQGQLLTGALAARGCRVHVADPHPERRERALRFGAAATHEAPRDDAAAAALRRALPGGRGAAAVVEAVGRPEAWRAAAALARPGGEVLLHGGCPPGGEVALPTGPLHYQELTLRGSYHHTPGRDPRGRRLAGGRGPAVRGAPRRAGGARRGPRGPGAGAGRQAPRPALRGRYLERSSTRWSWSITAACSRRVASSFSWLRTIAVSSWIASLARARAASAPPALARRRPPRREPIRGSRSDGAAAAGARRAGVPPGSSSPRRSRHGGRSARRASGTPGCASVPPRRRSSRPARRSRCRCCPESSRVHRPPSRLRSG